MEEKTPIRQALEQAFEEHGVKDEQISEVQEAPAESIEPEKTQEEVKVPEVKEVSGDESKEDAAKVEASVKDETKPDIAPKPETPVTLEDVPQYWKAEDKALWAKVPSELRPILKKYEDMRNTAVARYKQAVNEKIGQWADASWDEVFPKERLRSLALEGKTPAAVTKSLWEWNDYLEEDAVGAITELAKRYDLTPDQLFAGFNNQSQPQFEPQRQQADPRVDQLIAQQQEAAKQQEMMQIRNQLDQFGSEKDATGKAKRPFWNDVKPYIKSILPLVYSENPYITDYEALDDAYNRAVHASPQVRTKLTSTTQQPVKFSEAKTQQAKEAAVSLTGSSSRTAEPPKTAKTARDAIEMAWREHSRR